MKRMIRTIALALTVGWAALLFGGGGVASAALFVGQRPAYSAETADRQFVQERRRGYGRRARPSQGERRRDRAPPPDQDRARDAVRSGEALPLGRIIGRVQEQCPGKFLGADLVQTRQGLGYRVLMLRPSGNRVTFLVDAATGAVLGGRCR